MFGYCTYTDIHMNTRYILCHIIPGFSGFHNDKYSQAKQGTRMSIAGPWTVQSDLNQPETVTQLVWTVASQQVVPVCVLQCTPCIAMYTSMYWIIHGICWCILVNTCAYWYWLVYTRTFWFILIISGLWFAGQNKHGVEACLCFRNDSAWLLWSVVVNNVYTS